MTCKPPCPLDPLQWAVVLLQPSRFETTRSANSTASRSALIPFVALYDGERPSVHRRIKSGLSSCDLELEHGRAVKMRRPVGSRQEESSRLLRRNAGKGETRRGSRSSYAYVHDDRPAGQARAPLSWF